MQREPVSFEDYTYNLVKGREKEYPSGSYVRGFARLLQMENLY